MLAELVTLWDIPQRKIAVEFEFIIRQVHSQSENENRLAYIQFSLFHLFIAKVLIVKSHKSLLWILPSRSGLYQDKHSFPLFFYYNKVRI